MRKFNCSKINVAYKDVEYVVDANNQKFLFIEIEEPWRKYYKEVKYKTAQQIDYFFNTIKKKAFVPQAEAVYEYTRSKQYSNNRSMIIGILDRLDDYSIISEDHEGISIETGEDDYMFLTYDLDVAGIDYE